MLVTREFVFDAAHNLPHYKGKCERLHGHTYRLQVTVDAPVNPKTGIAFDFAELGAVVKKEVIEVIDHTYLNERIPISSAENLSVWIWERVQEKLPVPLTEIKLFETPTSSVTYRGE